MTDVFIVGSITYRHGRNGHGPATGKGAWRLIERFSHDWDSWIFCQKVGIPPKSCNPSLSSRPGFFSTW